MRDPIATIRDIVAAHVPVPAADEDPLSLTSLDVIVIARDVEKRFSVRIGASEFRPENFQTIAALASFVRHKQG